jgi:hypothetical protein
MGVAVKGVNDQELAEQAAEAQAEAIEQAKREAELEAMEEEVANNTQAEAEVITEKKDTESAE